MWPFNFHSVGCVALVASTVDGGHQGNSDFPLYYDAFILAARIVLCFFFKAYNIESLDIRGVYMYISLHVSQHIHTITMERLIT